MLEETLAIPGGAIGAWGQLLTGQLRACFAHPVPSLPASLLFKVRQSVCFCLAYLSGSLPNCGLREQALRAGSMLRPRRGPGSAITRFPEGTKNAALAVAVLHILRKSLRLLVYTPLS